jgi:AraC-like DNA-binding protein
MFVEVLRRYIETLPPGQRGWLAGLRDEFVGRGLGLLHADPAHPWTIDELAGGVSMSRSAFADRFTAIVGQPPMQYLAQWRMQLAAGRLAIGNAKVAAIAEEVGYESEAAFSRAFKRLMGVSPAAWRRGA